MLALVIVTYQGEGYVAPLLRSLRRHTDLDDVALIIVDNASSDDTLQVVREETEGWQNVHVLALEENTGFAGGNNRGLELAKTLDAEFALLLNQDIEVTPNWLHPLLDVLRQRRDVAAVQPLVTLFDEPELINSAGNALHFCGFGYCADYRQAVAQLGNETFEVAYCSGAALLLRMSALQRSGFFDERFFLYHEDADLQIRLRKLGFECAVCPRSQVLHKYEAKFSPFKYALLERNRWFVLIKHWPLRRLAVAAVPLFGVELATLAFAHKEGWLPEKLGTYRGIANHFWRLTRERNRYARSSQPSDAAFLTSKMVIYGKESSPILRGANALLDHYWKLARRLGVN